MSLTRRRDFVRHRAFSGVGAWTQLGTCPRERRRAARNGRENTANVAGTGVAHVIPVAPEPHVAARVADKGDSNEEQDGDEFLT